jgi:hypothetical protein
MPSHIPSVPEALFPSAVTFLPTQYQRFTRYVCLRPCGIGSHIWHKVQQYVCDPGNCTPLTRVVCAGMGLPKDELSLLDCVLSSTPEAATRAVFDKDVTVTTLQRIVDLATLAFGGETPSVCETEKPASDVAAVTSSEPLFFLDTAGDGSAGMVGDDVGTDPVPASVPTQQPKRPKRQRK